MPAMKNHKYVLSLLALAAFGLLVPAPGHARVLKDLNDFFPFHVPKSLEAWKERKAQLKRRVLVANGLYPLPERTPLKAVIHGKVERPGFTVEKVYFESYPGLHVTGLLFRPAKAEPSQKFPAVLSPHGHGGRLQDHGEAGVRARIKIGDEKFEDSGRYPKVARCANLARLGCVVFLYDMIGYADNQQLDMQVGHRIREVEPNLNGSSGWGFYSAQAELRLQSVFGVQTWNSIRGIDFLQSLPDVDSERIAVTGGSGGGTQTIMVCAIDDRPVAAFPNGMISSSMQGGCVCENASLLRIGTGNVELAALFAPKPQGMTAADDWTREMLVPGKGFPELKRLYSMYGKPNNVVCGDLLRFKHNYNVVTRELMYAWFNHHLELGHKEPIKETDFRALTSEEHAVYDTEHTRPEGGDDFQRDLNRWLAKTSDKQLAEMPRYERNRIVTTAWQTIVGLDDTVKPAPCPKAEDGVVRITVKAPLGRPSQTAIVPNPRRIPAYTHGYNHSRFALLTREVYAQILTARAAGDRVQLVAERGMEAVTLAACVVAEKGVVITASLENDAFRFATITDWRDPHFVPGAVKYGDLPGLVAAAKWLGVEVTIKGGNKRQQGLPDPRPMKGLRSKPNGIEFK